MKKTVHEVSNDTFGGSSVKECFNEVRDSHQNQAKGAEVENFVSGPM